MQLKTYALGLTLATGAVAGPLDLPSSFNRFDPIQPGIKFEPCFTGLKCGRFEVPMDYNNPTAGKASLAVVKYSVPPEDKLGTLLVNPGGPGTSGISFLTGKFELERLRTMSSGRYDLVSWDPRGVGKTFPRADCFASERDDDKYWNNTIPRAGIEARGSFARPEDEKEYLKQVPQVDCLLKNLGTKCLEFSPDVLQYVGTMSTVRDMVALHDHLEGSDKRINYWGFSYGTIIGTYFANTFPERVGRLILDGVVDPEYYAEKPPHLSWMLSINEAHVGLDGFFEECLAAGPTRCALAKDGATHGALYDRIVDLINRAYDDKKKNPGSDDSSASVRSLIFNKMYRPTQWQSLATKLDDLDTKLPHINSSDLTEKRSSEAPNTDCFAEKDDVLPSLVRSPGFSYALQAITCADAIDTPDVTTQTVFDEILNKAQSSDHVFGPYWGSAGFYCHRWPVRAVERYTGPWNKPLDSKILVIGNKGDPITPLASAEKVANGYGASAALIERRFGHTSLSMDSNCTLTHVNNYLLNGVLPDPSRVVCESNKRPFPAPLRLAVEPHAHTKYQLNLFFAFACAAGLALVYLVIGYVQRRREKGTKPSSKLALGYDTEKQLGLVGGKRDSCS